LKYRNYNDRLQNFFERVESGYQDGQPLHIANPPCSGFAIISFATFQTMPLKDLHALLRRKNVVVTGCVYPNLQFDEVGLRSLAPLDSQISIQGKLCVRFNCTG